MDTRVIQSWLRFVEPNLIKINKVVILGFGSGEHVFEFQKKYPHIEVVVVDPRKKNILSNPHQLHSTIQYVSTLDGIIYLKKILKSSSFPIPILNFRPCWNYYKTFFILAEKILIGFEDLNEWKNTPSHFIMESLFV